MKMARIKAYCGIMLVVILFIALMTGSEVKGANVTYTIPEGGSLLIKRTENAGIAQIISMSCFSGATQWDYVKYNSDGSETQRGIMTTEGDEDISLGAGYSIVMAPCSGDGVFTYSDNSQYEITVRETEPVYHVKALVTGKKYTLSNNSSLPLSITHEGTANTDYIIYDSNGEMISYGSTEGFLDQVASGNYVEFSVSGSGNQITYNVLNSENISFSSISFTGEVVKDLEYDLVDRIYTIENTGSTSLSLTGSSTTTSFFCMKYDSAGNLLMSSVDATSIPELGVGERMEIYLLRGETSGTLTVTYPYTYEGKFKVSAVRQAKQGKSILVYLHFPDNGLVPVGLYKTNLEGYYIYTYLSFVNTPIDGPEDTVGGFSIGQIKDETGMASVSKWYVYDVDSKTYYKNSVMNGSTLSVKPFASEFYNQMKIYAGENEYHIYVEWETKKITKGDSYDLKRNVEYTLGEGTWTVEGDDTVYSGDMSFYLNDDDGNYTLTLQ